MYLIISFFYQLMPINSLWEIELKKINIPWREGIIKFFIFFMDNLQLGLSKCLLNDMESEVWQQQLSE